MNPLLAAGVLAAAHQLGIMPDSPIVASIIGYLAGHHGHSGDEAERLRAALAQSQSQLWQAQQRELALRQALGQQAQAAQMQAALEAAREASQRQ